MTIVYLECIDASHTVPPGWLVEGKVYECQEFPGADVVLVMSTGNTSNKRRFRPVPPGFMVIGGGPGVTMYCKPFTFNRPDTQHEDDLRAKLTRPCGLNTCQKCGAPLPCDYHR